MLLFHSTFSDKLLPHIGSIGEIVGMVVDERSDPFLEMEHFPY